MRQRVFPRARSKIELSTHSPWLDNQTHPQEFRALVQMWGLLHFLGIGEKAVGVSASERVIGRLVKPVDVEVGNFLLAPANLPASA